MSAEPSITVPPLVHLIESTARPGRVRRVEYLRRVGDDCVVVGPLAGECRCAGFGLRSAGSALPRTIGPVLAGLGRDRGESLLPCSWSYAVARRVAEVREHQVLVADAPPCLQATHDRSEGLLVVAPDEAIADGWRAVGARAVRVLPTGALADRAPNPVERPPGTPVRVGLFCDEAPTEEDALLMVHRFGVVAITDSPMEARMNRDSPHHEPLMRYARRIGRRHLFRELDESGFPGEIDVALVNTRCAAASSEQVLDLVARGVVTIALTDFPSPEDPSSLRERGLFQSSGSVTNAGAPQLLALCDEPGLLSAAAKAAAAFGRTRPITEWASGFRNALAELLLSP